MLRDNKIRVRYNTAGHPLEWTINLPGYDHDNYIPPGIDRRFSAELPGWYVCNRGSRIEVTSSQFTGAGDEFTDTIVSGIRKAYLAYSGESNVEVEVSLVPYVPLAPVVERCSDCDETGDLRAMFAHRRETGHKRLPTLN